MKTNQHAPNPAPSASPQSGLAIETLHPDRVDDARVLFDRFPFKQSQRRAQSLDQPRLNDFYHRNLQRAVDSGTPHWIARRGAEPLALASLAPDPWHSEIYDLRMGKIATWMNALDPAAAGPPLLAQIERAAADAGFEHLSARLDGQDYPGLHLFERAGFLLIDVSVKVSRPMVWPERAAESPANPSGCRIRLSRPDDAEWMMQLGGSGHTQNHFLNDPSLPPEKTRRLFSEWVRKCIDRLAWRIYVLEDPDASPRGFVIYLRNRAFADAVGRNPLILDYVVLDPDLRGAGLGHFLIEHSLRHAAGAHSAVDSTEPAPDPPFDYCELRTSQHNHPALAAYEKLGFRICATDFILHRTVK